MRDTRKKTLDQRKHNRKKGNVKSNGVNTVRDSRSYEGVNPVRNFNDRLIYD